MFSFSDVHTLINSNLHKIPNGVDLIVGIPRTGLIPAAHIAVSLNLPLKTLSEVSSGMDLAQTQTIRAISGVERPKHVLVVDDTSNTGLRMKAALQIVRNRWHDARVTTLVMCSALNSQFHPDLQFEQSRTPRLFAWNMLNHDQTQKVAVDLDGVLCVDPTPEENDDGENYLHFIRNAALKTAPYEEVKAVITGRLAKYRIQTEDWLKANGIRYELLLMNDAPTAAYLRETRFEIEGINIDQISEFKSRMIKFSKPSLFVESNLQQAKNIHHLTKVNTYAFDSDQYFGSVNFEF